jgi:hypothetical protein
MPGAHRNLQFGPDTCTVSAAVTGGQLVMADTANPGKVKPATAGALTVLGVALANAAPVAAPADPLITSAAQPEVAVQYGPADVDLTFATGVNYGELVIAAASGQVAGYSTANITVTGVTTAASIATATTLVSSVSYPASTALTVDSGAAQETKTTSAVSGSGPYTLTIAALTNAHPSGAALTASVAGVGSGTFDAVVGRCTSPNGVQAGSVGRVRLFG